MGSLYVDSVLIPDVSFDGTISILYNLGANFFLDDVDIDVYYSGESGSYHTGLSPVQTHTATSGSYDNINININNGITLTSGSVDTYTVWVNVKTTPESWWSKSGLSQGTINAGISIPLSGNTSTTLGTDPGDLRSAGFTSGSNPIPYANTFRYQVPNPISFIGDTRITGSLYVSHSIYGNLIGTASHATSASFASTASYLNTLNQNLTFNGNLTLNGTASINYLNVIYETASVIYSSGSNQFGDAVNDTQTLYGSVRIPVGSLTVTGSIFVTQSHISTVDYIDYTINPPTPAHLEGRTHWDQDRKTLQIDTDVNNFAISAGHMNILRGRNTNSFTLTKGTVVFVNGNSGQFATFGTASWENDANSAYTIGIVAQDINANQFGYAVTDGEITGINTNGFAPSTLLYLSSSGQYTSVKPTPPYHTVRLGQVIVSSTSGILQVKVDNGYELGELHDVLDTTTTSSYGDLLVKSGSLWINTKQLTGSYSITGSLTVSGSGTFTNIGPAVFSGSIDVTAGITGSLLGTATTASYVLNAVSSSFATTASYINVIGSNVFVQGGNSFGATALIGTNDNQSLILETSGSARVTLNAGGGVSFNSNALSSMGAGWAISSNTLSMPGSTNGFIALAGDRTLNFTNGAVNAGIMTMDGNTQNTLIGNSLANVVTAARLVVRGAGATSATNTLRIENSAQTASLVIRNDNAGLYNGNFSITGSLGVTGTSTFSGNVGIGAAAGSPRLYVGGGGDLFLDFGGRIGGGAAYNSTWNRILLYNGSTGDMEITMHSTGWYLRHNANLAIAGNTALGKTVPNARLDVNGTTIITGSLIVTGGITGSLSGSGGSGGPAFPFTGSAGISGTLSVTGAVSSSYLRVSGSGNVSTTGPILTVIGSGSAQPLFTVQGSQGELFSVTDSLSGSLFSVNDISGLPILEVFSDNTILMGDYQDPMLLTTKKITQTVSGPFTIYSIPTASYDGAFIDYTVKSGSNARAGTIMSTWAGSSIEFTEVDTMDIGSTTAVNLSMVLSGANAILTGSSSTGAWTIRTIIRTI
jgi:hypothetical protein